MKSKKTTLLVLTIAITFLLLSAASFAQGYAQGGFRGKAVVQPRFSNQERFSTSRNVSFSERECRAFGISNLELSQEQITEIDRIRLEFQNNALGLRNEREMKKLEAREMMRQNSVDMEKVKEKWEEVARIQTELRVKALEHRLEIKEVLTAEQLDQLNVNCPMERYGMGRRNYDGFKRGSGFRGNRR